MKIFLKFLNGGEKVPLEVGSTTIGRKGADIPAVHELVSSKHIEITFTGARLILTDLNSTNGTFIKGEHVQRQTLKNGDIVSLGDPDYNLVPSFKVVIEGNELRTIYKIKDKKRGFSFLGIIVFILIGLFLFFGEESNADKVLEKVEQAEQSRVSNFIGGTKVQLSYGCTAHLSSQYDWMKQSTYEKAGIESKVFSSNLATTTIWNKENSANFSKKNINITVSLQKFKDNFTGEPEEEAIKGFVWHEDIFKTKHKINTDFIYRKTKSGIWQWVMWFDGKEFKLHANSVNNFSRIIYFSSSNDARLIVNVFLSFADSLWCTK